MEIMSYAHADIVHILRVLYTCVHKDMYVYTQILYNTKQNATFSCCILAVKCYEVLRARLI